MKIKDQHFVQDSVEIDGNTFDHCIFEKCKMIFRARASVSFLSCTFNDVSWIFEGAAGLTLEFMKVMSEGAEDYGRLLVLNSFPKLKELIKAEYLPQAETAAGGLNESRD